VPGKVAEGGAHPGRPSMARWQGASAVVLNDGGRALVVEDDRRRALGHQERKGSKMHDLIEDGEGWLLELTVEAEVVVASNPMASAALQQWGTEAL
jgi:hypothetical protein